MSPKIVADSRSARLLRPDGCMDVKVSTQWMMWIYDGLCCRCYFLAKPYEVDMTKKRFQGTGTALVTPFRRDGSIDEPGLRRLVDFQIDEGIDMLLPCGTTGEGATLDAAETDRVLEIVVEQSRKRVPVIIGAGSNSTAKAIQATKSAGKRGADGVLSVGPYYNKPTQQGFFEHFKAIAEAEDIPV